MALHPLPCELIHDPEFDHLLQLLGQSPQMFVNPVSVSGVCAWIDGFDRGRGRTPLLGLREWLVTRAGGWSNLFWHGLALREIVGTHKLTNAINNNSELISKLVQLIQSFLAYRNANGLTMIYWEYAEWLRKQEWYSGPLPPNFPPPTSNNQ